MEDKPKMVYEWVLVMSKGDDVVLSESQYEVYREQIKAKDMSRCFFADVEFNPPFVVQSYKRKAQYIKDKYPCKECYSSGRKADNTGWCPNCGGSGVDLPKA